MYSHTNTYICICIYVYIHRLQAGIPTMAVSCGKGENKVDVQYMSLNVSAVPIWRAADLQSTLEFCRSWF